MLSEKEKQEILRDLRRSIKAAMDRPISENSQRLKELHSIARQLDEIGCPCYSSGKKIIDAIDKNNIDTSKLNFPQGSYEKFKKDVADGVYAFNDYDREALKATTEEDRLIDEAVAAGKVFIIH